MEDKFELLRAQASGPGEDALPGEYVDRLLAGETPLRVWREFRRMTLDQLSKAAGIAKGTATPGRETVGKVTREQLREIATDAVTHEDALHDNVIAVRGQRIGGYEPPLRP